MYEEGISTYGLLSGSSLSYVSPLLYPYSAVVTFKTVGSLAGYGSGFVIGPNVVLTAGHCIVNENGTVMSITDYRITYNANTIGGESGGPVFDINNIVQAVHTHGYATGDPNPLNSGTRINSLIFNLATEKKNEGKLLYNY